MLSQMLILKLNVSLRLMQRMLMVLLRQMLKLNPMV